jgi:RNA polymerase sigma factor (sigma-70 family)
VLQLDLGDPSPEFLARLDSDRDAAVAEFRRFAEQLFRESPPPNYLRIPPDDREDVVSEVILHCIDNDCSRLRRYHHQEGALFAGWFATVAYRKIADLLRREKRREGHGPTVEEQELESPEPDPEQQAINKEFENIFLAAVRQLGRECRLLLRLRLLEFTNREIAKLLRLPPKRNKTIGNQVIECRKKLARLLRRRGFFEFGASGT